jgi:[acyl-carrier-protein] S-malonyltransferase
MNKFAIVCSGQGSLDSGVFAFSSQSPKASSVIEAFSNEFHWDMLSIEGGKLDLTLNQFSQPLTVATALANWELIKDGLPKPSYVAGYSAGEVSAIGCSGAVDLKGIAKLCRLRCEAMEKFAPADSGMLAVRGITKSKLLNCLNDSHLHIAICIEDDHFVIAGSNEELEFFERILEESGVWVKRLFVSMPSHTPLMLNATEQLQITIADLNWDDQSFTIPVIQGINGMVAHSLTLGVNSMARAVSEPVQWHQCMQTLADSGVSLVLELGPGGGLSKMISAIYPTITARSVMDFRTPQGLQNWVLRQLEV